MSEFKEPLPVKKHKSSNYDEESECSKNNICVETKQVNLGKSTIGETIGKSICPIRAFSSKESERHSTHGKFKKKKIRSKSYLSRLSKPEVLVNSSPSGNQPSTSTCNQSITTSFSSHNSEVTNVHKDTVSSLNLSRDVGSSCITPSSSKPISSISSKSISHSANEPSISFGSFVSSVDVPRIASIGDSSSSIPNLLQFQNKINLSMQNVENANNGFIDTELHEELPHSSSNNHLCTTKEKSLKSKETHAKANETNSLSECNKSSHKSMYISHNDVTGNSCQTNECLNRGYVIVTDAMSEESQLSKIDPLRQFDVLDELEVSDHEEGEIVKSNSDESNSECDEELPVEEIDEMLEEGLPENLKGSKNKETVVKLRRKVVLEEIGHNHFDLLPEGWVQIMHSCGMPVYLNQKGRVCTMARPYYLGPGSSRNHKIPLSAIPCLHYKRASELEKKNEEEREKKKQSQSHQSQSEIELMSAEIETFEENKATQSLEASELHEYCKKVFKFKSLTLIPFKTWADRRKYVKMRRDIRKKQRPSLPGGTKLLKFPIKNPDGTVSKSKGEWIINPNGKSYVCILHEYVQHALKKHPKYQFKELENPATPYSATVFIEDMEYGFGMGASKKHAKVEAAKAALEVLIPGMKDKIEPDNQFGMRTGVTKRSNDTDISIFDQIKVEDPRVAEFCSKSTEPPPYAILLTCLGRNTGVGEIELSYEMSSTSFKQDQFTMSVGNHKATVACRNKREGKQKAAQAILKALHPNITFWGSLLRMYGNRSIKDIKEKKQQEQEITQLQSKASLNQPNFAILDKLKTELFKLKDKKDAVKAKGQFILPENIVLPSLSSTDLNKVNLCNK